MAVTKNKNGQKFIPSSALKNKVKEDKKLNIGTLIQQADDLALKSNPDLVTLLHQDLDRLGQTLDQVRTGDYCPSLMKRLYNITNDISVNSENLGRKLLVNITDSLCNLLEDRDSINNNKEYEILMAHFDALRVIVKQDESYPGADEMAALLIASLRQAVLAL